MKTTFLYIVVLVAVMFVFAECKKNDAASVENFAPLTPSTNWTYKYTEASVTTTFKLTVTNRDTVANGKTYKVISSTDGTTGYSAKVGNDYYRFASFPAIGINNFEELYLKDNKAVNDTWTGATSFKYSGIDVTVNLNYTIKGKGESFTVNGTTFNDVTHVRLDLSVLGSGIGGGDFYYQQGVGLIEDSMLVTPPPGIPTYSAKQEIISYEIK